MANALCQVQAVGQARTEHLLTSKFRSNRRLPSSARNLIRSKLVEHTLDAKQLSHPPKIDYADLLSRGGAAGTSSFPPPLFLAPMEVLADSCFRRAFVQSIGGVDEACHEFIRIPDRYSPGAKLDKFAKHLVKKYDPYELSPTPLAAQIMGGSAGLLADCTRELIAKGAPRVDLNCGCPAKCVTGKGAGSSLLKDPELVYKCVSAMAAALHESLADGDVQKFGFAQSSPRPVLSVKMRSGFLDTGLFRENVLAAQEAGASFITIHPRTKTQGYKGGADWTKIAEAKSLLHIPVIGNGDVTTPEKAVRIVRETGCDGVMIGRGAVQDPFIYHRIRRLWSSGDAFAAHEEAAMLEDFLRTFAWVVKNDHPATKAAGRDNIKQRQRSQTGRLKQVSNYLFQSNDMLAAELNDFLRLTDKELAADDFLEHAVSLVHKHWAAEGAPKGVLVNNFSGRNKDNRMSPAEVAL